MNCHKIDLECQYRMPCESSLCTLQYCQRNYDEIIFLLQKINSKFNHINKSQVIEEGINLKTVTINSSDDNKKFPTKYMTTTTKKRGRPKQNDG